MDLWLLILNEFDRCVKFCFSLEIMIYTLSRWLLENNICILHLFSHLFCPHFIAAILNLNMKRKGGFWPTSNKEKNSSMSVCCFVNLKCTDDNLRRLFEKMCTERMVIYVFKLLFPGCCDTQTPISFHLKVNVWFLVFCILIWASDETMEITPHKPLYTYFC